MQTFPGARQEYKLALSTLCLLRASGTSRPLPSVEKQMAAPREGAWGCQERGVEEEQAPPPHNGL